MDGNDPFKSVFTTLPWNGIDAVGFLDLHLQRLSEHAQKLGIKVPADLRDRVLGLLGDIQQISVGERVPAGLVTVTLDREGGLEVDSRENVQPTSPVTAISLPAPRWNRPVQGTKHGAWSPYLEARERALAASADVALLVEDGAIIDGDRATPLLLDGDGTAWAADSEAGGIDSVTLKVIIWGLKEEGIPFNRGRLHEEMIGRAREMVLVGTGIGVARIAEIDGQMVGMSEEGVLSKISSKILSEALEDSWEVFR